MLTSIQLEAGPTHLAYDDETGYLSTITTAADVSVNLHHDGMLLAAQEWTGPTSGEVRNVYGDRLTLSGLETPGPTTEYNYDRDGLITRAGDFVIERDSQTGLPVRATLGVVESTSSYDSFGDVRSASHTVAGAPMLSTTYQRDPLGRITAVTEDIQGQRTTTTYAYDAAGRLASVGRNGHPAHAYRYDTNGNRVQVIRSSGSQVATYDHRDRLVTAGDSRYSHSHEATHAMAARRGVKDTSRAGRWHNRQFVALAEALGMEWPAGAPDPSLGGPRRSH